MPGLYVSRVDVRVEEADVVAYLVEKFPGGTLTAERLSRRDEAGSVTFKVGADMGILDELIRPETWSKGVLVKRLFLFSGQKNVGRGTMMVVIFDRRRCYLL